MKKLSIRDLDLRGELVGSLGIVECLLQVGALQLLRVHQGCPGLGEPRTGLGANGTATRGDVILGGRDLGLRIEHGLGDGLLCALLGGCGIPNTCNHSVDLCVRGFEALKYLQRCDRRRGERSACGANLRGRRSDSAGHTAVGVVQTARLGNIFFHVCNRGHNRLLTRGEVGAELVDSAREQ